jgi:ribonuclease G
MSKEMIISVNGREKKIAIVDNGQVTEFYIERGEENSGVVGNIYKGRVMRVLPGMQSAFVDIGLERDAFLYVSDFFDEEEEIERIVMEKSEKSSPEEAEREATDHIHKERLKREKQMEDVQEIAEPLAESDKASERSSDEEDEKEDKEEQEEKSSKGKRQRSRRGKKPKDSEDRKQKEDEKEEDDKDSKDSNRRDRDSNRRDRDSNRKENKEYKKERNEDRRGVVAPVIEFDDFGFERIIDDTDTGDMFKDAYMQEAIVDKVRAIEFEMESAGSAAVGSLIDSVSDAPNGFQRVADEDEDETQDTKTEKGKSRTSRRKKKATKKEVEKKDEDLKPEETEQEKPKTTRSSRSKQTSAAPKTTAQKSDGEETKAKKTKSSSRRRTSTRNKKPTGKNEKLADAQVNVKEEDSPAEMAVRRGGRGRRRTTKPNTEDKPSDDNDNKKNSRSSRGNGNRRPNSQPTITDLLNEGQEILVQIAKEPIARKGARITSHIALPGRFLVYMPTIEHLGVSRKIESAKERSRLRTLIQKIKDEVELPSGGFIVRTAGIGISDEDLAQDARYLVRTWMDIKKDAEKAKSPELVHQDLDIVQRLLRDHLSDDFAAIRVDSEDEYRRIVEFINLIQPRMVKRVKFYAQDEPILERFGVQEEINKALKPRVWLRSGGYLVINQTEALVAIDVNTGKFVGKGNARLEDTITKTNMEAVEEIARQIRLRDLGGIIVLDLIDMEDRRNRHKVLGMLQDALQSDKSPTKVLSFNDFGLIIMTRKRVKQSLERTLCSPCEYCDSAGWVKSAQTICYEILDEARRLSRGADDVHLTTLRVHPEVAKALRETEGAVLEEIEAYLGNVDVTGDSTIHQEQFDFAFI